MSDKQDEHNRGQRDGAEASGFDELIEMNNPLTPAEFKKGFQHGRRQRLEAEAREDVKPTGSRKDPTESRDEGPSRAGSSLAGFGGAVGGGASGLGSGIFAGGGRYFMLVPLMLLVALLMFVAGPPKPYKPSTLPTAMTSGPSGTSFYTGNGDPLAFQAYNDGNYFLKQSKYEQAIPYFTEAIRRQSDYWDAYIGRADAYRFLDRNDLALHDYSEAVRLRPNKPQGYLGRGMIEDRGGHYQEAITDINHSLSLKPAELLYLYYSARAMAYLDWGQYPSAIEDFNETLRLTPNDSISLGNRGAAYAREDKYERALEDYNQALQLDPTNAWLHLSRGVTYEHLEQYEYAIREYDEAIRLNPNYTDAYTARQNAKARMSATTLNGDATPTANASAANNADMEGANSAERVPPQNQTTTTTQPEAPPAPSAGSLQLGTVTTCEYARSWGVYQPKTTFRAGDRLCVYAEALHVNQNGLINLLFTFTVSDRDGQPIVPIMSLRYPVVLRGPHLSWGSWQYFNLPRNMQPGTYTVRVDVSNNLTRESVSQLATFSLQ